MQTQTIKTELLINGKKVVVGHQFLESIITNIPDIKENQEIFSVLALSDNPDVRESIAHKDNLSRKTIEILLEDTNQEVVDNVLNNSELAKKISENSLLKIIQNDNTKLLFTLASNVDDYIRCDLCKIVKILANHKSASIRYSLLAWRPSDIVSLKMLKQLSQDKDFDVAQAATEELDKRR